MEVVRTYLCQVSDTGSSEPLVYYDTLKYDETVIRPTILYTFIDLMYALLASFTKRDEEKGRRI
jgi:hypothetical protein